MFIPSIFLTDVIAATAANAAESSDEATEAAIALNNEIANFGPLEFLFSGFGILIHSAMFVLPLFLATRPANIAKKKGRSFGGYYLFGYFALIPAIIVTLVQKPVENPEKSRSMHERALGR